MKTETAHQAALRLFEMMVIPNLKYIMVQPNEEKNGLLITAHYEIKENEGAEDESKSETIYDIA